MKKVFLPVFELNAHRRYLDPVEKNYRRTRNYRIGRTLFLHWRHTKLCLNRYLTFWRSFDFFFYLIFPLTGKLIEGDLYDNIIMDRK